MCSHLRAHLAPRSLFSRCRDFCAGEEPVIYEGLYYPLNMRLAEHNGLQNMADGTLE